MQVRMRMFRLEMWPSLAWTALFSVGVVSIIFLRLGSLTLNPAVQEVSNYTQSNSIAKLIDNPVNAPYKIATLASVKLYGRPSAVSLRVIAATIGLLSAGLFYFVLRHWHTPRIAAMGTGLMVGSSWFLHTARYNQPLISQLLIVAILALGVWFLNSRNNNLDLMLAALTGLLALYTPGLPWILLIGIIWQRKRVKQLIKMASWQYRLAVLLCFGLFSVPLVFALSQNKALFFELFWIPAIVPSISEFIKNLLGLFSALFWKSPINPAENLGDTPKLDIFTSVMMLLGLYAYYFKLKLDRSRLLLVGFIGSILLTALNGLSSFLILLPFIYILVIAGVTLMIQQWFTVFPRNPVARRIGFALITAVVGLSVIYNLNRYFIAWPNSPETKQVFKH